MLINIPALNAIISVRCSIIVENLKKEKKVTFLFYLFSNHGKQADHIHKIRQCIKLFN